MTRYLRVVISVLRWREWYNSKLPVLFAIIYYAVYMTGIDVINAYIQASILIWITICYAAFGYVINSWSDRNVDNMAGKYNAFGVMTIPKAMIIIWGVILIGLFSVIYLLQDRNDVLLLVLASYVFAFLYSMPPTRFKEHFIGGPIMSTLAQRTMPAIYIVHYFTLWDAVAINLIVLYTLIGFRFIIVHQLSDYWGDLRSGTNTFVTLYGVDRAKRILVRYLFPLEIISLVTLLYYLSHYHVFFVIFIFSYVSITIIKYTFSKHYFCDKYKIVSYSIFDDIYNLYLPIIFCFILLTKNIYYVPFIFFAIITSIGLLKNEIYTYRILMKSIFGKLFRILTHRASVDLSLLDRIESSIACATSSLISQQNKDGSFPALKWWPGKEAEHCHGLFLTSNILLTVGDRLPGYVVNDAISYIKNQRKLNGLWNFLEAPRIPDDSDTTACSIACIATFATQLLDGNEAELLRQFWRHDGGPFQTWIPNNDSWISRERDDAVVNTNVLLALDKLGATVYKREIDAVHAIINRSLNGTRYYHVPSTLGYSSVRAGISVENLPEAIRWRPKMRGQLTPRVQWMLAEDVYDSASIRQILSRQLQDGSWPEEAWFTGVNEPFWGSPALSTSICLAALHRCREKWLSTVKLPQK